MVGREHTITTPDGVARRVLFSVSVSVMRRLVVPASLSFDRPEKPVFNPIVLILFFVGISAAEVNMKKLLWIYFAILFRKVRASTRFSRDSSKRLQRRPGFGYAQAFPAASRFLVLEICKVGVFRGE